MIYKRFLLWVVCVMGMAGLPAHGSEKVHFAVLSLGSAITSGGAVYLSLKYDNSVVTSLFVWSVLTGAAVKCITEEEESADIQEKQKQALFIVTLNALTGLIFCSFGGE